MHKLIGVVLACSLITACSKTESTTEQPKAVEKTEVTTSSSNSTVSESKNEKGFPTQVFWGDTHLHTTDSPDAFGWGNRLGSEDALRFARGDKVTASGGLEAQLKRPLDFLVITDHAVGLGLSKEIYDGNPKFISDPVVKRWHEMFRESNEKAAEALGEIIRGHGAGTNPPSINIMSQVNSLHLLAMNLLQHPKVIINIAL